MYIYLCIYKLRKNSVNTQKQQFENDVSESILCGYAFVDITLIEIPFSEIFTSYSIYIKVPFL